MKDKIKIIIIVGILLLTLIVSIQNTQAVETRLLFVTVTMPRVLLLLLTFVMGIVGGLIIASHVLHIPAKSKENS